MFELCAKKNQLKVLRSEPVTSGSVNVYEVRFAFSEDWAGLKKTAVFRAGEETVSLALDASGTCAVPWEVLAAPGRRLEAGVCGTQGEELVLPTVWADLGYICSGAAPGKEARPPTPELWRQELARKGDGLGYTEDGELGLYSGEELLSAVPLGGGGAANHWALTGREAEDQHPVGAISGLEEALEKIPAPVEPMTNEELEEILK